MNIEDLVKTQSLTPQMFDEYALTVGFDNIKINDLDKLITKHGIGM